MIESHTMFTAAPGGLVSVGAGWPSPAAWVVAGVAIAILALIARWSTRRRRRKIDPDIPTTVSGLSRHRPALTQRGLTQTEQPKGEQR